MDQQNRRLREFEERQRLRREELERQAEAEVEVSWNANVLVYMLYLLLPRVCPVFYIVVTVVTTGVFKNLIIYRDW